MKVLVVVIVVLISLMLLVGVACVGLCGGLGFWAYSYGKEVVKEADAFLSLVGQGKYEEAYQSAAAALRSAETLESFKQKMQQSGLDGYQSANWNHFDFKDTVTAVSGTATTKQGPISVTVFLTKENDKWRVLRIETNPMGGVAPKERPAMPNEAERLRLAKSTIRRFERAIRTENFDAFYETIADSWKKQSRAEEFQRVFEGFFENKDLFRKVLDVEPVFTKNPTIDENGVLTLHVQASVPPRTVMFELRYEYEDLEWRLVGINVSFKKGQDAEE